MAASNARAEASDDAGQQWQAEKLCEDLAAIVNLEPVPTGIKKQHV